MARTRLIALATGVVLVAGVGAVARQQDPLTPTGAVSALAPTTPTTTTPTTPTAPTTTSPTTPRAAATPALAAPKAARPAVKTPAAPPVFGGDVSWPNCPLGTPGHLPKRQAKGLGMPGPAAEFVVIGLTNGPGFYPNPCLAGQVAEAQRRHLFTAAYAFTTLPNPSQVARFGSTGPYDDSTALGRLRNAADAQARINVASMVRTGLRTPIVWIDVEPQDYLSPWGSDVTVNRAVIRAVQRAYEQAGYRTGFYSAPYAWDAITGGWQDSSPTWVTSGPRPRATAEAKCAGPSFSGGPVALSQYWVDERADLDVTCPLLRRDVARWFASPTQSRPAQPRPAQSRPAQPRPAQ